MATNSITQGEQVSILWPEIVGKYGMIINFAHRTFAWDSDVKTAKAHVHCVIIGFSKENNKNKVIYDYTSDKDTPTAIISSHINPYLIDYKDVFIYENKKPINENTTHVKYGNMPNDGSKSDDKKIPKKNNLLLSEEEKNKLLKDEPEAKKWVKEFVGGAEYISGIKKYCLWLNEITPNELRKLKLVSKRVEIVKKSRLLSKREATKKLAKTPYLFGEIRQPKNNYILIPRSSSERREYIPIGFLSPNVIAGDTCVCVDNATLYDFGILISSIHMAWVRTVGGRLKSDYRYSNTLIYNNFPWPNVKTNDKERIIKCAVFHNAIRW